MHTLNVGPPLPFLYTRCYIAILYWVMIFTEHRLKKRLKKLTGAKVKNCGWTTSAQITELPDKSHDVFLFPLILYLLSVTPEKYWIPALGRPPN